MGCARPSVLALGPPKRGHPLIALQAVGIFSYRSPMKGEQPVASITIRNLDEDVKTRLRVRAAKHNRSMEEEVRIILSEAVKRRRSTRNLVEIARSHFGPENGVDLELPPRGPMREPPSFD